MDDCKVQKFLDELTALSKKHGIRIDIDDGEYYAPDLMSMASEDANGAYKCGEAMSTEPYSCMSLYWVNPPVPPTKKEIEAEIAKAQKRKRFTQKQIDRLKATQERLHE